MWLQSGPEPIESRCPANVRGLLERGANVHGIIGALCQSYVSFTQSRGRPIWPVNQSMFTCTYVCTKNGQRREYDGELASDVHPMYTRCTPYIHLSFFISIIGHFIKNHVHMEKKGVRLITLWICYPVPHRLYSSG